MTNHGDIGDYQLLAQKPAQLLLIPGVEISSEEGDFLIFSTDMDFLASLQPLQPLPERSLRPRDTAVVWAHPFAGAPGGLGADSGYLGRIAGQVDGIEVFNGNWPDTAASEAAVELARRFRLAQLGGSDAHREDQLLRCWTEVERCEGVADLIGAIKQMRTEARRR